MIPTLGATTILDRMSAHRGDTQTIEALTNAPNARFLILADLKPVIRTSEKPEFSTIRWFSRQELSEFALPTADALFLGRHPETGVGHFALAFTEHRVRYAPGAMEVMRPIVDLRSLAMQGALAPDELSLLGQARALAAWHEVSRCCGRCGGTTNVKDGGWRRKCWACGQEHFPRTDPVVIMLITHGDRCLLGHEERFSKEPRMYSTLAGFIEPGEDIEHAVRREVWEEAGIRVGRVRYHSSQPWPFPHSLMLGCIGEAETTDVKIDPKEIEEARWFDKDEVRLMLAGKHPKNWWVPGQQAIARALITSFAEGH
jgi:NAD+ diphosphatase